MCRIERCGRRGCDRRFFDTDEHRLFHENNERWMKARQL